MISYICCALEKGSLKWVTLKTESSAQACTVQKKLKRSKKINKLRTKDEKKVAESFEHCYIMLLL